MILNNSLIPITLLIGIVTSIVVTAFSEQENETSGSHTGRTQNSSNEELIKTAMFHNENRLGILKNMEMDAKSEDSLKNMRSNISDNQLSNEYISIEHEDDNVSEMTQNISLQHVEHNIGMNVNDYDDYETEIPLSRNNRAGRLITTTTTTIPQYIRRQDEEQPISSQRDINVSSSDYVDDEIIEQSHKYATKMPFLKDLDNSSEENDDIVLLAMKYYDAIPSDSSSSSSSTRHIAAVSSEDYYDEDLQEPVSTTTTTHAPDNSMYHSPGFATSTRASVSTSSTTTTKTTATPTPTQQTLTIMEQIAPSLLTTMSPLLSNPLPLSPSLQPQTRNQTILDITTTSRIAGGSAVVVPLSDKKGKQIPIISTVPVVTTTSTTRSSRRRLLPHEQLRNYIEDAYIRMPLAVIVDPSAESLDKTKKLWNDAMRTNLNIKIVLVTLNESQEESPAAFNFNNTRQFLTGLNSIKEQNSGDTFRGISHAAELVPYDSAVFISTAQLAKHTDQVQDSAITLLKKRIRLYLIWFGERSLSENETQDSVGGILGEVAIRSGGEILHIVSSENFQELEGSTLTIVADALRGSQEVDVPVDTTLSSLHVKIDKLMRRAVLETPNGG